jgi:hypothetical protein
VTDPRPDRAGQGHPHGAASLQQRKAFKMHGLSQKQNVKLRIVAQTMLNQATPSLN